MDKRTPDTQEEHQVEASNMNETVNESVKDEPDHNKKEILSKKRFIKKARRYAVEMIHYQTQLKALIPEKAESAQQIDNISDSDRVNETLQTPDAQKHLKPSSEVGLSKSKTSKDRTLPLTSSDTTPDAEANKHQKQTKCIICSRPIPPNLDNACAEYLSLARMRALMQRKTELSEEEEALPPEIIPKRKPRPEPKPAPFKQPYIKREKIEKIEETESFWESLIAIKKDPKKMALYAILILVLLGLVYKVSALIVELLSM